MLRSENFVAKVEININAPVSKVWKALIKPELIKQYMFGTTVTSNWTEGSEITWKGNWEGQSYEDKGEILKIIPEKKLQYTHYSPASESIHNPDNYHIVTIELSEQNGLTNVLLTQDNNTTEEGLAHSKKNWTTMLNALKKLLEGVNETTIMF
jgi:uncharacterized protein YndB with AHSA1/START domain